MADVLGWRAKFAVLIPSTNTVVQPELDWMRPDGVTNHIARIAVPNMSMTKDEEMARFMDLINTGMKTALDAALSCDPDSIIIGMSSETFWNGLAGSRALKQQLQWTDRPIIMGSEAADAALKLLGAKRLGILTPYLPIGDAHVLRFFTDLGYHVEDIVGLCCASPTLIAHTPAHQLDAAVDRLAELDVDAVLQCGTNLPMARLAAVAERRVGKPVIAINTALYWHALRTAGISDRVDGFGQLLSNH